ncbi:MAG: MaoC family dehydratase [Clostridia bacterium]
MKFEDLYVGQRASLQKTFTDADVKMFAGISTDVNPLHISDEFAKTTVFKKRVVHGMLSASLISAVLANVLPGPGTIYLGQELKFKAPVYLNDDIKAVLEVIEIRADKHIVKLQSNCFNQNGDLVIEGVSTVKF